MKGRVIRYSADELAFIQSVSQWDRREALQAFLQKFRRDDVTLSQFNALCKRNGWFTGRTGRFELGAVSHNKGKKCAPGTGGLHPNSRRTQFKCGQTPHNTKHVGHERVDPKDGYTYISVAEQNPHTGYERRYVLKHKWLWEQLNGPVPDGYALKCLDSNPLNTDPSNWEAVHRGVLARLNGGRLRKTLAYDDAAREVKPLVMAAAKLKHAVHEKRKRAAA